MATDFKIVIVGSGPAGLSAAVHAAKRGVPHLLIERAAHVNDTIFKYQKRKHVMATPEILPLRSDLDFKEESREEVIDSWIASAEGATINLRTGVEVTAIQGEGGAFTLTLSGGQTVTAEFVVLAIGVQGNLNHLRIPGADLPFVQYQLDDPDEYKGEEIAVIGVGDAGLENALALAVNNNVSVINTGPDFPRAKAGNVALIGRRSNAARSSISPMPRPPRSSPARWCSKPPTVPPACPATGSSRGSARSRRDALSRAAASISRAPT